MADAALTIRKTGPDLWSLRATGFGKRIGIYLGETCISMTKFVLPTDLVTECLWQSETEPEARAEVCS